MRVMMRKMWEKIKRRIPRMRVSLRSNEVKGQLLVGTAFKMVTMWSSCMKQGCIRVKWWMW